MWPAGATFVGCFALLIVVTLRATILLSRSPTAAFRFGVYVLVLAIPLTAALISVAPLVESDHRSVLFLGLAGLLLQQSMTLCARAISSRYGDRFRAYERISELSLSAVLIGCLSVIACANPGHAIIFALMLAGVFAVWLTGLAALTERLRDTESGRWQDARVLFSVAWFLMSIAGVSRVVFG